MLLTGPRRASGPLPRATYRIQLTPTFGFEALERVLPYLAELGVSHVYLSPCLEAVSGSSHGYDVTDPARVRSDFGGAAAAAAAFARARALGLGVVLDIVPNHMAASAVENPWWRDLLRWGPASPYARYFDVDWTRHEGRLLLPILGVGGRAAFSSGEVWLELEASRLELHVGEQRLPVAARSLSTLLAPLAPPGSELRLRLERLDAFCSRPSAGRAAIEAAEAAVFDFMLAEPLRRHAHELVEEMNEASERLGAFLEAQHYRLRFWRAGLDELNYRRFFDVSSLAALRVQDPVVFEAAHVQIRRWLEQEAVDGLRVDHPDGLDDPEQYFERLRELLGGRWLLAEKILAPGERLRETWPVDGTTGYDFASVVTRLFVDRRAEASMTATYCRLAELPVHDFERAVRAAKGRALRELFGAELAALTARALPACQGEHGRGFGAGDVQRALAALITYLPVYRTYLRSGAPASPTDQRWLEIARRQASAEHPDLEVLLGRLADLLLGTPTLSRNEAFATAFQQLAAPAMAKGLEDTVYYDDARLIALNEVGGDPGTFGAAGVYDFHAFASHVQARWPRTLLASSTHDTKRSEDVRLRIALLSELPEAWSARSAAWMRRARALPGGAAVDPRTVYFMLQTLVGVWPISEARLQAYLLKAAREAKAWTTWLSPDLPREAALAELVSSLLGDGVFTAELAGFLAELEPAFLRHSLAATLLRLTAPGVPDIYQGTELSDLSLADPDNRRPVDYARCAEVVARVAGQEPEQVLRGGVGQAKPWLVAAVLALRRELPECFEGGYLPLVAVGTAARHVVAFARGGRVVSVVLRLTASLPEGWGETRVILPPGQLVNVLTGERIDDTRLSALLARCPVALLRSL